MALAQVPVWQELRTPYMGAWAAGTNITRNGQSPNYVFRVSANDDLVDRYLARYAAEVMKKGKPGLLLENTAWGQSNEAGLGKWLGERNMKPVGIEKFNWNDPDMSPQLLRLKGAGADHVILVANAPEGAQVVKSRAKIGWEVPMISHWGISAAASPSSPASSPTGWCSCRPTPSSASRASAGRRCSRRSRRSTASRDRRT